MLLISYLIVIFSIVAGFIGVDYKDTISYQDLAEKHLENILSLSNTDISNHIENSMTKPVMVSKTMANDEFLKGWLLQEPQSVGNGAYMDKLYSYLKAYQEKYSYTTVFCISAQTGNYYYQDGFNKTVSKNDEHDVWYYNFMKSGQEYDIELDTNQTSGNNISIFVNFRVEGNDGKLLGIIGVGLQVEKIEDTIRSYEKNYGLSVYIINVGGAQNSFTGDTDMFVREDDLPKRTTITEPIELNKSATPKMQWFTTGEKRICLITEYNDTLGWYLVLEKDTSSISSAFQKRVQDNMVFMIIALVACVSVTTAVFINYNGRIVRIENTDELTGLPNRKLFAKQYAAFARKHKERKKTMFMLDIDSFKNINDTYGHVFGNTILAMVGEDLRNAINGCGTASRWGGDEFLGILAADLEEAKRILSGCMEALKDEKREENCRVTVSIGMTEVSGKFDMEQMIKKADEAMYRSKEAGRDRITVI
jgi:diguanylate cyclase (GGDEF) domain